MRFDSFHPMAITLARYLKGHSFVRYRGYLGEFAGAEGVCTVSHKRFGDANLGEASQVESSI